MNNIEVESGKWKTTGFYTSRLGEKESRRKNKKNKKNEISKLPHGLPGEHVT